MRHAHSYTVCAFAHGTHLHAEVQEAQLVEESPGAGRLGGGGEGDETVEAQRAAASGALPGK